MQRLAWLIVGLVVLLGGGVRPAGAEPRVEVVARLPGGDAAYGLALGPDGLLYAGGLADGTIFAYWPSGALQQRISIPAGPSGQVSLRGLAFDSLGNLYAADLADGRTERGRIVKITPRGRQSVFASGLTAPVGLAFDRSDVLYVTDGLNGVVRWISPDGASAPFAEDERLKPRARHGFGASGLAFAPGDSALYVSNTADDRILKVTLNPDGSAGRLSELADGSSPRDPARWRGLLDGPEGLAVDDRGNLLVAAGRSDKVERYTAEGRLLGQVPAGPGAVFASPTSLALSGGSVYVANLAAEGGAAHLARFSLADLDD